MYFTRAQQRHSVKKRNKRSLDYRNLSTQGTSKNSENLEFVLGCSLLSQRKLVRIVRPLSNLITSKYPARGIHRSNRALLKVKVIWKTSLINIQTFVCLASLCINVCP